MKNSAMAGERCATRLSTTVASSNVSPGLKLEIAECRRHGYILTGKFLGQGAYAKVYLGHATWPKINTNHKLRDAVEYGRKELKVAIKIISTESAPKVYIQKFLPREIASMNRCYKHVNVLQLYDIFATVKRVYLVLEFAAAGDLLTYINSCCVKSSSRCVPEEIAKGMFIQIAAGLKFIHKRGIAHRDLKCENVLLTDCRRSIKLSDFGFATETNRRENLKTHCGSYAYAPPEILKQQKYDGRRADLWSLGVVLFAMVNGGLPFKESEAKAVLDAMKSPVYFRTHLSSECKELIRGLLRIRPQSRLSLDEVFAHPWLTNVALPTSSSESLDRSKCAGKGDIDAMLKQYNAYVEPSDVSKFLLESMKPHKPKTHWRYAAVRAGCDNQRSPDSTGAQKTVLKTDSVIPNIAPKDTKYTESFPVISPDCATGDKDERSCGEPKHGAATVNEKVEKSAKSSYVHQVRQDSTAAQRKPAEITEGKLDRRRDVVAKEFFPPSLPAQAVRTTATPMKTREGNSCPGAWVSTSNTDVSKETHKHLCGRQTASPNVVNICIDQKSVPNSYDEYQRLVPGRKEEKRRKQGESLSKSPRKKKVASQGVQVRNIDKRTREQHAHNFPAADPKILHHVQPRLAGTTLDKTVKLKSCVAEERPTRPSTRMKAKSTSPPVSLRSARYVRKQQECRPLHDARKTAQDNRVNQKWRATENVPRIVLPKKPNLPTDSTANKPFQNPTFSQGKHTAFINPPCMRSSTSPKRFNHEEGLVVDSQVEASSRIPSPTKGGDIGGYVQIRPFSRCPRGLALGGTPDAEKQDQQKPEEPGNVHVQSVWRSSPDPKYTLPHTYRALHEKSKAHEFINLRIRRQRSYHRVSDDPQYKTTHGARAVATSNDSRNLQKKSHRNAGSADSIAKDEMPHQSLRQAHFQNSTSCSHAFKARTTSRLLYKRLQEPRGVWHARHAIDGHGDPSVQHRNGRQRITVGGSQPLPSCGPGRTDTRPKTEQSARMQGRSTSLAKTEHSNAVVLKLRKSNAGGGGLEKQIFTGSVIAALVD